MTVDYLTEWQDRALQPWPIDQVWRKGGYYVAVLTGPDARYGVGRDFLTGKPVRTRHTVEYGPQTVPTLPAWILRRPDTPCGECGQTRPVRDTGEDVIAAYQSGWVNYGPVFGTDDLLTIHAAGPPGTPGTPGAWQGDRCHDCDVTPTWPNQPTCQTCDTAAANRDHVAALPETETF